MKTHVLAIETSASPYSVVLATLDGNVTLDSTTQPDLLATKDIGYIVNAVLERSKCDVQNIQSIAVNIGPGGTSAVRSGVAFANALAFSVGIPVAPFSGFEIMGYEAWKMHGLPVICTRKAMKDDGYVALYNHGQIQAQHFGPWRELVSRLTSELAEWSVAGAHRDVLLHSKTGYNAIDSGVAFGHALTLLQLLPQWPARYLHYPKFAYPVTEQSEVFLQ